MERSELMQIIRKSFENEMLDDGIGLSQANAIDDYESEEIKMKCRESDEKQDWSLITSTDLNKYNSSL